MRPDAGERLRAGLASIAEADGDAASATKLALDAKKHAPRISTAWSSEPPGG